MTASDVASPHQASTAELLEALYLALQQMDAGTLPDVVGRVGSLSPKAAAIYLAVEQASERS